MCTASKFSLQWPHIKCGRSGGSCCRALDYWCISRRYYSYLEVCPRMFPGAKFQTEAAIWMRKHAARIRNVPFAANREIMVVIHCFFLSSYLGMYFPGRGEYDHTFVTDALDGDRIFRKPQPTTYNCWKMCRPVVCGLVRAFYVPFFLANGEIFSGTDTTASALGTSSWRWSAIAKVQEALH